MPAAVTAITPGRGRPGDGVVIAGSGFSVLNNNTVTFNGVPAVLGLQTATSITVLAVPAGPADQFLVVVVTNNDDATSATWWWWSKQTLGLLVSQKAPRKIPGPDEVVAGLQQTNMRYAEAKYFERIATKLELLKDLLTAKGSLASGSQGPAGETQGLRLVAPGLLGEILTNRRGGAIFFDRKPTTLNWGLTIAAGDLTPNLMGVGAADDVLTPLGTEDVVTRAGTITVLAVYCVASATSRVNLIELLVNGGVVETISLAPGLQGGQGELSNLEVPVLPGDRVEVRLTKNNTFTAWSGRAYAQVE